MKDYKEKWKREIKGMKENRKETEWEENINEWNKVQEGRKKMKCIEESMKKKNRMGEKWGKDRKHEGRERMKDERRKTEGRMKTWINKLIGMKRRTGRKNQGRKQVRKKRMEMVLGGRKWNERNMKENRTGRKRGQEEVQEGIKFK